MNMDKAVSLPKFDGKQESFQLWWMRFSAYARVYQFGDALKDKAEAELPDKEDEVLDLMTDAGKAKKVAKR